MTAQQLPLSAGPDYPLTRAAINFYMEQGRLAKMPEDEALATFSPFGDARILRPPLPYIFSALTAELSPLDPAQHDKLKLRQGSSILLALAVVMIFVSVYMVFEHWLLAFALSMTVLLMPQMTFLGSYANDDASAIFVVCNIMASLIALAKYGVNMPRLAWLGLAIGLALISKATAWLILPFAALYYLVTIAWPGLRQGIARCLGQSLWVAIWVIIGGGWWIIWNITNYGIDDPLARNVISALADKHSRRDVEGLGFYATYGVNMVGLLVLDFKGFWMATYKAVVGHIDWLALPMSPIQYLFYAPAVVAFILGVPLVIWRGFRALVGASVGAPVLTDIASFNDQIGPQKRQFGTSYAILLFLMLGALLLQFFVFVWHNVYNDIQIQGKYLLPAILPFLLVALSLPMAMMKNLMVKPAGVLNIVSMVLVLLTIAMHVHALTEVVIPFYAERLGT